MGLLRPPTGDKAKNNPLSLLVSRSLLLSLSLVHQCPCRVARFAKQKKPEGGPKKSNRKYDKKPKRSIFCHNFFY